MVHLLVDPVKHPEWYTERFKVNLRRVKDLAERVLLTFVGAFIAVYLTAFAAGQADLAFLRDPDLFDKAQTAGIAAMVPLVAGLFGFRVGDKNTASVIPSNKPEAESDPEPGNAGVDVSASSMDSPANIAENISEKFQYWYKEEEGK